MMSIDVKRDKLSKSPSDDAAKDDTAADVEMLPADVLGTTSENNTDEDVDSQDEVSTDQLRPLRLELTPELQLDSTEPVLVEVLDCTAPVKQVLKWLTTPSWCVSVTIIIITRYF